MKFVPVRPRDAENVNVSKTHPLKEAATLLAGLVGLGLLVTVALVIVAEAGATRIPPEVELRAFASIPTQAEACMGPEETALAARHQPLLDRLAGHWAGRPYDPRLGVLPLPDENAFAVPGGVVLVTRGLLDRLESENALAMVLGHELGHLRGRDHMRRLGRGLVLGLVLGAVTGSGVGGSAPDLLELTSQMTGRSFDRRHEEAADAFGLSLVQAEYGHVAGALAFFEGRPDAGAGGGASSWLSTHPATGDRIAKLRALAEGRGWATAGEVVALGEASPRPPPPSPAP